MNKPVDDLIAKLQPMSAPPDADWWPLAWGWWAIIGILIAIIGLTYLLKLKQKTTTKKIFYNELKALYSSSISNDDSAKYIQGANQLLKRYVYHCQPDNDAVALTGKAWVDFLAGNNRDDIRQTFMQLCELPYKKQCDVDISQLHDAILVWIKNAK